MTVTIKHKTTGELKTVDCGVEFKDYTFVSEATEKVAREYPDYDFVSRISISDTLVKFYRPLTYGF